MFERGLICETRSYSRGGGGGGLFKAQNSRIGIYKHIKERETLVGQLPMELSLFVSKIWRVRRTVDYYFHPLGNVD